MDASLPLTPHCYEQASITLPPWEVVDPSGSPSLPTAIAYTIRRIADGSVVGAAARDGLGSGSGANGVSLNAANVLVHSIGTADNVPLASGSGELRRVEYTLTFAGGVVIVRVEYYLRVLDY